MLSLPGFPARGYMIAQPAALSTLFPAASGWSDGAVLPEKVDAERLLCYNPSPEPKQKEE
jgi:hypothetical protein